MKLLLWDIETSPMLANVWGLWNNDVSLNQLLESGDLLCFAAKWHGQPKSMKFFSEWDDGHAGMVLAAWNLLNEADAVISYNGKHYDTPWINRCFLEQELLPPAPAKQIDLCDVVKRQFRFPSNKLAYVSERLLGTGKVKHEGHELWTKVLAGDPDARKRMRKYNKQDVRLLEPLYDKLLPWIPGHPSYGAFENQDDICPACGSTDLVMEGFAYTAVGQFQRYHCADCGKWSRSSKRVGSTNITQITG
jgi:hypothetical protein